MSAPLAERQRLFASWLLARDAPAQTPGLLSDARASAAERLHVYRYAYEARLLEVLRDDFPALLAALGRERFDALAAAYLRANPSQHFSLRYAGARLPGFLAASEHALARELRAASPWAADLARLEQAVTDAFDAADMRPLARADLAQLAPVEWQELRLALMPGAQLLALTWPVRALREAHDAERPAELASLAPCAERVLVWRREERVLHRACGEEEYALLAHAAEGIGFAALCAQAEALRGEGHGAAFAASLLARWVDDALLAGPPSAVAAP